jgi:hypothetical protein
VSDVSSSDARVLASLLLCVVGVALLGIRLVFGYGATPGARSQSASLRFVVGILVPVVLILFGLSGLAAGKR